MVPREDMKREEVSGVCRLSAGAEGVVWSGREGAECGDRPPLAMHTPLCGENTAFCILSCASICVCACFIVLGNINEE